MSLNLPRVLAPCFKCRRLAYMVRRVDGQLAGNVCTRCMPLTPQTRAQMNGAKK